MHEQPCSDLWQVNYTPPKNHSQTIAYVIGGILMLVPILSFIGIEHLQHSLGIGTILYYTATRTAI